MSISSLAHELVRGMDAVDALWNLLASPTVDPATLARAIEAVVVERNLDWRTLQLVKEGWEALEVSIEKRLLNEYLFGHTALQMTAAIRSLTVDASNSHGDVKFPSLKERLMPHLSPITVRQFLRELGSSIASPATITLGGAASLVVRGLLSRATEDLDIVDEVPVEIREERQVLQDLSARYGLRISHFQSHYLPRGWETRTIDFGTFGKIHVRLVDAMDIIGGKVFSARPKDLDDFRLLSLNLNKEELRQRVLQGSSDLIPSDQNRRQAIKNWYIVYGDDLGLEEQSG